jgi:molybdopterin synthase sulfur carrier subunit
VNDTLVFSKNFELKSGDKISLLPPVCGGWNVYERFTNTQR